jgi:hypothetical protein
MALSNVCTIAAGSVCMRRQARDGLPTYASFGPVNIEPPVNMPRKAYMRAYMAKRRAKK